MSEETQPPKIEFPCPDYPIKVMGTATESFHFNVVEIISRHAEFDNDKITTRDSRNGRYISVTVFVTATGEAQLKAIFEDLKTLPETQMVL